MKDQESHIAVFVAYLTFSSSIKEHQPRYDNSITCRHAGTYGRFIKILSNFRTGEKNFMERIKAPIFLVVL